MYMCNRFKMCGKVTVLRCYFFRKTSSTLLFFLLMYLIRYFIMFLKFASALTKLTGAIELIELPSASLAEPLVSFIQQSFRPNV